jgi:hypothetical protein
VPAPAPGQRSAALSSPGNEARQFGGELPQIGETYRPVREPSQFGLAVPLAWPNAYEDVLGFALWPNAYDRRLRAHGIGDVLVSMFAPGEGAPGRRLNVARAPSGESTANDTARALAPCASASPAEPDWPAKQIELSITTTRAQRIALDQLRTTVSQAVGAIRTLCRDERSLTAVERIRSMQDQLWSVQEAAILVREPLASFFDSLTDEQRKQFVIPVQADPRAASAQADLRAAAQADPSALAQLDPRTTASLLEIARKCGMPLSRDWPVRQIAQAVQPNEAQRASLDTLQKAAFEMGQLLIASCLTPAPATPAERLDAATDRLTAVIFAASTVALALNDFYGQLSDEQKSKLNALSY